MRRAASEAGAGNLFLGTGKPASLRIDPIKLSPLSEPFYRHAAFPLVTRLTRRGSHRVLRELRASTRAPRDEWRKRQDERVRALVRWAYDTVPEHRRRFDEAGVRREDIRGVDDLQRLPILTKRDLQTHATDFHSLCIGAERHWVYPSSGTTGEPLMAVRDVALRPLGQGTFWHALEWCGLHPADSALEISSHRQPWIPSWRKRAATLIGARPVTASMVARGEGDAIDRLVRGWRPRCISGQPQRLAALARMVLDGQVRFGGPPDAVVYYGSVITETERTEITRAFRAPIHSRYATTECVPAIAYTCEHGWFHVNEHHFAVEVVDGPIKARFGRPGSFGRILVTDLTNFLLPYLRYEVGDLVEWGPGDVCPCGSTWRRLTAIHGRHNEAAHTRSGRQIPLTTLMQMTYDPVPELPNVIWEYQFQQHALDDLEMWIVPRDGFGESVRERLENALSAFLGGEMRFRVKAVDAIPVEAGGKRQLLVSAIHGGAERS